MNIKQPEYFIQFGPLFLSGIYHDDNGFISDPITVDYDLDYKADAVYFGTVSGNATAGWGSKLRRIVDR